MLVQRARPVNPYTAYQAMIERRGLLGEPGQALREPEPNLAQLAAPSVKARLLAHAQRYEHLGSMLSGLLPMLSELSSPSLAPIVSMVAKGPLTKPTMTERTLATPASLAAATALALPGIAPETTATMTSEAPVLRLGPGTPATAATLTLGKVALSGGQSTKAELRGDKLAMPHHSQEADFGTLTINGVTTTLGVLSGNDDRAAVQFIADRLNANQANTVTASIEPNGKRLVLSAKVPGTAGNIRIDRATSDSDGVASNDASTGFQTGDRADGKDVGSTDFGSVTINGVTTTFGALANDSQTPQTAAQWLVERLNAATPNDFTASVGGADRDQIVLTSKALGSEGQLSIDRVTSDSDGDSRNNGSSGFVAGWYARGQDAKAGETDFGSVTISGVTTSLGRLSNAGLTTRSAAQFMVERLNANPSNRVVASLGGADMDRVVLTAKTPGSAGSFRIDQSTTPDNGWVSGREAKGQDTTATVADFGSITINGITTQLGVVDGRQFTTQSAMQYLVDRLNQTNPTLTARAVDGRIELSSKETGSRARLEIQAVARDSDGDASNDLGLGFAPGQTAVGKDERLAPAQASALVERVPERSMDREQVARRVGQAGQFIRDLNHYLQALQDDPRHLPGHVKAFGAELKRTLRQEAETFSQLGIGLQGDRLEVDEAALEKALSDDPEATADHFKRLHQALEATVGAQAFALDHMRASAKSTGEIASTISQVSASLYKIQRRAKSLGWILEQAQAADNALRDQSERIRKLPDGKQDERESRNSTWKSDRERDPRDPLSTRQPVDWLAPTPANPGSEPRWPFGQ